MTRVLKSWSIGDGPRYRSRPGSRLLAFGGGFRGAARITTFGRLTGSPVLATI
jgi:hypothetical protein